MRYAATNMMAKGLSKGELAKEVKKGRNPNIRAHNFRFGWIHAPRQSRPNAPDLLSADTWIRCLSQGSFVLARDANDKKNHVTHQHTSLASLAILWFKIMLIKRASEIFSTSPARFSETIPANIFFERCNISESFNAYCNPNDLNFAIEHVYVGCGMIARSSLEQPP